MIDFIHFGERDLLEAGKYGVRFRVACLDLFEPGARLVVQGGVLVCLLVEFYVDTDELFELSLLHRLRAAPAAVGDDQLAELRAVVSQVVDAHHPVSQKAVDLHQGASEHRRGEVPDVKGLRHVDGGIVDADCPAGALVRGAVRLSLRADCLDQAGGIARAVDFEVEIAVHRRHFGQNAVRGDRRPQFLRDRGGGFFQQFGKAEAGQRIVAQVVGGRHSEAAFDFLSGDALDCDFFRNIRFIIHFSLRKFVSPIIYHIFLRYANQKT